MDYGPAFTQRFKQFKEHTQEERIIAALIKGAVNITPHTTVLDIGGGAGNIARLIQPYSKNVCIVDPEPHTNEMTYIKGKWEDIAAPKDLDLILMSHVYGKFERAGTLKQAYEKAIRTLAPQGSLALCYNQGTGMTADILYELKKRKPEGLIDFFDETLLPEHRKNIPFSVQLRAGTFTELADYIHVLFEMPDQAYARARPDIETLLMQYLSMPVLEVRQNIVIVPAHAHDYRYNCSKKKHS